MRRRYTLEVTERENKRIGLTCFELPGLHLWGEPEKVFADVWKAIQVLKPRPGHQPRLSLQARKAIRDSDLPGTLIAIAYGVRPITVYRIRRGQDPLLNGKSHAR